MPTDIFDIAVDGDDGRCEVTKTTWPVSGGTFADSPGGTLEVTGRSFFTPNYTVPVIFLRFDTSSIPDAATVESADLLIRLDSISEANVGRSIMGDYYDWGGAPSTLADWTIGEEADAFEVTYTTLGAPGNKTIPLSNVASISKTGYTGIRIKGNKLAADAAPTGNNLVQFVMREHATQAAPQLSVTYTEVAPTPADAAPFARAGRGAGW